MIYTYIVAAFVLTLALAALMRQALARIRFLHAKSLENIQRTLFFKDCYSIVCAGLLRIQDSGKASPQDVLISPTVDGGARVASPAVVLSRHETKSMRVNVESFISYLNAFFLTLKYSDESTRPVVEFKYTTGNTGYVITASFGYGEGTPGHRVVYFIPYASDFSALEDITRALTRLQGTK